MRKNYSTSYGIDFGTSNSTVSVARDGKVETLAIDPISKSPFILRSVLYFAPKEDEVYFGEQAVNAYLKDISLGNVSEKKQIFTGKYIKVDKPIIGDSGYAGTEIIPELIEIEVGDAGRLVQSLKSGLGVSLVKSLLIFDKEYAIEEIAGKLLSEIKKRADAIVKEDVRAAVIGRPVNFVGGDNKLATERLEKAARLAGFEEIIFEYEPLGAARSYEVSTSEKNICFVFDFGGGTLDFSLVEFPSWKILSNDGLPLGGDLLNSRIFEKRLLKYFGGDAKFGDYKQPLPKSISENLKHWYHISLLKSKNFLTSIDNLKSKCNDPKTMDALLTLVNYNLGFAMYEEIDRAKKMLSEEIKDKLFFVNRDINIDEIIFREDLENIIHNDLLNIDTKIDEILKNANTSAEDINTVITTGGSSLIPSVQVLLKNKFTNAQVNNQHAFTSVSYGLAQKAMREFTNR